MRFRHVASIGVPLLFVLAVAVHASMPTDGAGGSCQLTPSQMARVRGADTCMGCEIATFTDCNQPNDPCVACYSSTDFAAVSSWACASFMAKQFAGVNRRDCKAGAPPNNQTCIREPDWKIYCYTQYNCNLTYFFDKQCDASATCNVLAIGSYCKHCKLGTPFANDAWDNSLCAPCIP